MTDTKLISRMVSVLFAAIFMFALIGPASAASQESVTRAQGYDSQPRSSLPAGGILIDHNTRDVSQIPAQWLDAARQNVVWVYGSTSHGTQLWMGAEYLSANVSPPAFKFLKDWWTPPSQSSPTRLRMGYDDSWSWDQATFLDDARARLDAAPNATAFMWLWCGQMSDSNLPHPQTVNAYLSAMQTLESEYPDVTFVYATGHTDQWNANRLNNNNNIIRQFAAANDKALYDFADIESYLPDGTRYATPNEDCPWCESWCDAHPGDCPNPPISECAHSHSFNCYLKGQAFWWLSARLAGWSGVTPGATQTLTLRSQPAPDGHILESSETSNQGGTPDSASIVFRLGDDAANKQYRAILSFNTNGLPDDAVITKVTLKIKKQGLAGTNPFTILGALRVDVRKPYFGGGTGLTAGDFQTAAGMSAIGVIPNAPVNNWYAKTWTTDTFFSYVNLTGITQFRLRFATDDNNDGGADFLRFFSGNDATAGNRPTLIIEYQAP